MPFTDTDGRKEGRHGHGSGASAGHRYRRVVALAKHRQLSRVQIVSHDAERAGHAVEAVWYAAPHEEIFQEALVAVEREEPRRQRVVQTVELFPQRGWRR